MRKKLLIAAILLTLGFLGGGAYMLATIQSCTNALGDLIALHRVQVLREDLLGEVRTVQGTLRAKDTRFFSDPEAMIGQVRRMRDALQGCFGCHHSGGAMSKLVVLRDYGLQYQEALSRVLTIRANRARLAGEEDRAYAVGRDLVRMLVEMIGITSGHLEERTRELVLRIRQANVLLFICVAMGPTLIVLLMVFFLRDFAKPLSSLVQTARRLKGGDLSARVPALRHEFKELGDAFNEMVESLGEQMRQMQRTEQMAVCGQLAAGVAHEIKNPLASISLTLQVLGEELGLDEADRQLFEKVRQETGRIENLMKDLMSYARPRDPTPDRVDLSEILSRAAFFGLQRLPAVDGRRNAVEIRRELAPDLPRVSGDRDQLTQVFVNVVLNAIEIMPDGGEISIRAERLGDGVAVKISDQGPGVPEGLKERIFEPFFTKKPKGTGLGLAVTKRLLEQNGGSIRVEDAPGGGACFEIRLPASEGEG